MSTCSHRDVIGHEHGAWCQECGEQVGGSMLREPVTVPSPLVLAADQLAQVAEKQLEFLEAGGFAEATELRTALSNYRKVREGL